MFTLHAVMAQDINIVNHNRRILEHLNNTPQNETAKPRKTDPLTPILHSMKKMSRQPNPSRTGREIPILHPLRSG